MDQTMNSDLLPNLFLGILIGGHSRIGEGLRVGIPPGALLVDFDNWEFE